MNEQEPYHQKKPAELDEWKAEIDKLKAKASEANADARVDINKELEALKTRLKRKSPISQKKRRQDNNAWESLKDSVDSQ